MAFTKTRDGNYVGPSGRTFTPSQVAKFYDSNGWKKEPMKDRITAKDDEPREVTPATKAAATRYAHAAMQRQAAGRMWRK